MAAVLTARTRPGPGYDHGSEQRCRPQRRDRDRHRRIVRPGNPNKQRDDRRDRELRRPRGAADALPATCGWCVSASAVAFGQQTDARDAGEEQGQDERKRRIGEDRGGQADPAEAEIVSPTRSTARGVPRRRSSGIRSLRPTTMPTPFHSEHEARTFVYVLEDERRAGDVREDAAHCNRVPARGLRTTGRGGFAEPRRACYPAWPRAAAPAAASRGARAPRPQRAPGQSRPAREPGQVVVT